MGERYQVKNCDLCGGNKLLIEFNCNSIYCLDCLKTETGSVMVHHDQFCKDCLWSNSDVYEIFRKKRR